jgi:hypothetical protein
LSGRCRRCRCRCGALRHAVPVRVLPTERGDDGLVKRPSANHDAFGTDPDRGSAFEAQDRLLDRLDRRRWRPEQPPAVARPLLGGLGAAVAVQRRRQPAERVAATLAAAVAQTAHHGARHPGAHARPTQPHLRPQPGAQERIPAARDGAQPPAASLRAGGALPGGRAGGGAHLRTARIPAAVATRHAPAPRQLPPLPLAALQARTDLPPQVPRR